MDQDVFSGWDDGLTLSDANAAYEQGRYARAAELYEKALASNPGDTDAAIRLASSLQLASRFLAAAAAAERAVEAAPDSARAAVMAAGARLSAGDFEGAMSEAERAHELEPESVQARLCKADLLRMGGNDDDALALLRETAAGPGQGDEQVLAALSAHDLDEPEARETAAALETHALESGAPAARRATSAFAAGAALERLQEYTRAFGMFRLGNSLIGGTFDADAHRAVVRAVIDGWPRERVQEGPRAAGGARPRVSFVLGMPRTGTTLVEQILSSHPDVFAGGELRVIAGSVSRLLGSGPDTPLTAEQLDAESERATSEYRAIGGRHAMVTDKNPLNFMHLGLIRSLFPESAIYLCTRDPVDTALSCWQHRFRGALPWANSFDGIAAFHRGHDDVTAHWRSCGVPMLEIPYGSLVEDPEGWSRRIVEHAGLEWDGRCLEPHKNTRVALTASNQQVRKQVYRSASGRSARYGALLDPLREALRRRRVISESR